MMHSTNNKKRGELLKAFRLSLGISQEAMGILLGDGDERGPWSHARISSFENGGVVSRKASKRYVEEAEKRNYPITYKDLFG